MARELCGFCGEPLPKDPFEQHVCAPASEVEGQEAMFEVEDDD